MLLRHFNLMAESNLIVQLRLSLTGGIRMEMPPQPAPACA